jgi:hypothetical protein
MFEKEFLIISIRFSMESAYIIEGLHLLIEIDGIRIKRDDINNTKKKIIDSSIVSAERQIDTIAILNLL